MSNELSKYFSKKPNGISILKAIGYEIKQFIFSIVFIAKPYEKALGEPERKIPWGENQWIATDDDKMLAEQIYQRSEHRFERLEEKSHKIFGIATFFIPIILGVFTYVVDEMQSRLVFYPLSLSLALYVISLWCSLRAIRVKERQSPGISLIINTQENKMESAPKEKVVACYLYCAQCNERVNDHIANFIRAAESFIFLAVIVTVLTGAIGLHHRIEFASSRPPAIQAVVDGASAEDIDDAYFAPQK